MLSENRSVVTKFPANDPVPGAEEVYIDNPLCPINPISFWSTTLNSQIISTPDTGKNLVDKIRELYQLWAKKYCKGQNISPAGLHEEAYFKYFDYPDFLTPYSGLIQIRKYAELEEIGELIELFAEISALTKLVREEIYQLLVKDAKYFE